MGKDRAVALGLLVVAVLYFVNCFQLKLGVLHKPGPGFVPLLVGAIMTMVTGIHLVQTLRRTPARTLPTPDGGHFARYLPWGYLGCTLAFPLLLNLVNFVPATVVIVSVMLILSKYRSWWASLAMAVVMATVGFIVFAGFLGVALPSGPVETWLYRLRW